MWQELLHWDTEMFLKINKLGSNSFFDVVLPVMRNARTWIPLYVFLVLFFVYRYRFKCIYYIGGVLLSFGLADVISAHIIKPLVERLRPCRAEQLLGMVVARVGCGSGFSFPSSHASNHFAIAVFLSVVFGKKYPWVIYAGLVWAAIISYSQVYVGVHYPIDVISGAILGSFIGCIIGRLVQFFIKFNQ